MLNPLMAPARVSWSLATLAVSLSVLLAPSPCAAQFGWAQSVPPEVVLGFQPRTPEEAAHPPRAFPGFAPLEPRAQRAEALAAGDGPGAVWSAWAPPGLCYHSLVHDSRRGVFYIVGGVSLLDPQALVWRYESGPGLCTPIATRPGGSEAYFSDAVYDSLRDRLLVLSLNGETLALDALTLPGLAWTRLWSLPSAGVSRPAGIAIDTRRDLLALLGVWDPDSSAERILRIPLADPGAWTSEWLRGPGIPTFSSTGSAVYDEARDRFYVVFDMNWSGAYPGMSWGESSLWSVGAAVASQWIEVTPVTGWGGGFPRGVARDRGADRLLVVDEYASAWSLSPDDGSARRLDNGNCAPTQLFSTRYGIATAFDPLTRRLHAHGGQHLGQALPMFMSLPVDEAGQATIPWRTDEPQAIGSRWLHTLLLDPSGNQLVDLNGFTVPFGDTSTTAVHSLSASSGWRHLDPEGQPQGRTPFASAYVVDRARHAVLAFGGQRLDGSGAVDDQLWSLSLAGGDTWHVVESAGPRPPARRFAQFCFDAPNNRFILLGGDDGRKYLIDAWELRMEPAPAWRELSLGGEQSPLYMPVHPDEYRGGAWAIHWGFRNWDVYDSFRPVYRVTFGADSVLFAFVPTVGDQPDASFELAPILFDPVRLRFVGFVTRYDLENVDFSDLYEVRLGTTATWGRLPTSGSRPALRGEFASAFDPIGNRMFIVGGYQDNQHYCGDTWQLQLLDYVTPVAISLASATADAAGAHLRWRLGAAFASAAVERSRDRVAWEPVGNARAIGAGDLSFDDPDLAPGESAAYRLRVLAGSEVIVSEPAWVTAPAGAAASLSLRVLAPAPGGAPAVLLSSAPGVEARLSLHDVSGRRIEAVSLAGGTRAYAFARRPAPGLYFAELAQRGDRRVARIVVTP